ncbi:protein RCC2 homolog isoform X2 [Oryza brachyantha]|uniref:protein RCC2 homolog isoform X2 n=1 Tax=Oryza brachyantha TaxID=4533 RepID=UPI001ADB4793|nr:protein RCC2 homolog isoform X2 [Oryza brachyantha]
MSASGEPEEVPAAAGAEQKSDGAKKDAAGPGGGELLYCGATNFETMGRKVVGGAQGNLVSPTRLRSLVGVDIRFVASGCTACHCVALDAEGRCYTWGRNEKGQLGHGDILQRNLPTVVSELSKYKVIKASVGRNHTVVVTNDGKSFSFGHNKHGQLGTGSLRNEIEASPVPCLVTEATNAVCGADFTVWLSSVEGSSILTAGLPQYGQLGHGTDNEYNVKDASVKLAYDPQPRPRAIASLSGKTIVKVACGTNHTVAVDSSGYVYTWGFGGYGRLGHREQKDEWQPRLVEVFQKHNVLPPNAIISAGAASSACTAGGGQLYMWGKLKNTGDDWMYPKPLLDLSGWNIRCMASGNMHHVVGADDSCISWGVAQNGELGYGPNGQKSSANPKKVDILEGMHVISVGCGYGLSAIVVDRAIAGDRLDQLDIYDGDTSTEVEDRVEVHVTKKPRASASTNSRSNKRKKAKDVSESDEDDDEEDESGDDENGEIRGAKGRGRGGKASNRGRGRGAKKATPEPKPSGRGRGRPKKTESPAQKTVSSGRGGKRGKRGRARK